ncbi:hypothetical protein L1987_48810 [Smallanthus sonchifolius]|uniref:Uncharacterized protein n=1 Tax=Smallanthus sonchifolius TaxID=185202 RepID=A0ACB9FT09_9ASTR|nr:hypothetical protein L1987_48810 [Smallanthus sonchifolius]
MGTKNLEGFNKISDRRGAVSVSHSVEKGVVRMKILVKRQELQQVLEQVTNRKGDNKGNHVNLRQVSRPPSSKMLEQRLKDMKRMRILRSRQMKRDCRSYWRPALESIPEGGVMYGTDVFCYNFT